MDFEKIAAEFARNGHVQNVNFQDIHDNTNVYIGGDGSIDVGCRSGVDPDEPLSYYITDAELRRQVIITAEQRCTKADNVKKLIYDLLVARGCSEGMLRSSEFLRALKAHLLQMPNVEIDALQRAFRENKK